MHGKMMSYLGVAGVAVGVGLVVAGTPIQSVLPVLLLLGCPLMMMFMMRGMGGHDHAHTAEHDQATPTGRGQPPHNHHH